MCGLLGFATTQKIAGAYDRAGFIRQGLMDSMERGEESTGLALIHHGEEQETPEIYKAAVCAFDFLNRPIVQGVLKDIEKYSMVLGHTRSATRGVVLTRNAHPFQHGHITLTHNGTIQNIYQVMPHDVTPNDVTVDSDKVALAFSRLGDKEDEEQILEQLRGPYSLVWHNSRDGTLNFARNDQKPLFFAFEENVNALYYASEYTLLVHLLERRAVKIDGKVKKPRPLNWIKFPIKDLRKFTSRPFVVRHRSRPPDPTRTTTTKTTTTLADGDWRSPTAEEHSRLFREVVKGPFDINNLVEIKSWLDANKRYLPPGGPKSIKKVQSAAKALKKKGYVFEQGCIMTPDGWSHYKKDKKQNLGQMTGFSPMDPSIKMLMHNVKKADWDNYCTFGRVYVRAMNVQGNNVIVFIHPRHAALAARFFRGEAGRAPDHQHDKGERDSTDRTYMGPNGQMVSLARFLELTTHGCGNCTGYINPELSRQIYWTGEPPSPICNLCQEDPKVYTKTFEVMNPAPGVH